MDQQWSMDEARQESNNAKINFVQWINFAKREEKGSLYFSGIWLIIDPSHCMFLKSLLKYIIYSLESLPYWYPVCIAEKYSINIFQHTKDLQSDWSDPSSMQQAWEVDPNPIWPNIANQSRLID